MKKSKYKRLNLNIDNSNKNKLLKWVNYTMFNGKKDKAEKMCRELLYDLKKMYKQNPNELLLLLFKRLDTPFTLVQKKSLKSPKKLSESRRFYDAVNPIIKLAQQRKGIKWKDALLKELEKLYQLESPLIGKVNKLRSELYINRSNAK